MTKLTPRALLLSIFFIITFVITAPCLASWEQGVSAFRAGRYEDAVNEFQALVNAQPVAPQGHYMLGLSLMQMGEKAAALKPLAKAAELDSSNFDYRLAWAKAQFQAGRADAALETLATQDPTAVPATKLSHFGNLLANVAQESGRDTLALRALDGALAVDDGSQAMWLAAATVAERLERPQQAFDAYTKAYRLDNGDAKRGRQTIQFAFTTARAAQDDETERNWYERGAEIAAELATAVPTAEHFLRAGEAYLGAQDIDYAHSWFERAAKADDSDPWAHYYLASSTDDDPEAALGHLQAALERSPDATLTSQIHNSRGAALRHLERFEEAGKAYELAGNTDKIIEMEKLVTIKAGNDDWDREKRRCEEKERVVEEQLADAELLEGTAGWREIEQAAADALAECRPYLDEAS